jgi:hypothetical protein
MGVIRQEHIEGVQDWLDNRSDLRAVTAFSASDFERRGARVDRRGCRPFFETERSPSFSR